MRKIWVLFLLLAASCSNCTADNMEIQIAKEPVVWMEITKNWDDTLILAGNKHYIKLSELCVELKMKHYYDLNENEIK